MNDVTDSIADVKSPVKGKLDDRPILVCTLQHGVFLLDLSKDEFDADDYIPFGGRPMCGQSLGGSPESRYGLEARG